MDSQLATAVVVVVAVSWALLVGALAGVLSLGH
jgi:hypothetical protein